jgi:hypothetical protein
MSPTPLHGPPTTSPARPYVLDDTGADGAPQAMLVTPGTTTIVDADDARSLIAELLLVLVYDRVPCLPRRRRRPPPSRPGAARPPD